MTLLFDQTSLIVHKDGSKARPGDVLRGMEVTLVVDGNLKVSKVTLYEEENGDREEAQHQEALRRLQETQRKQEELRHKKEEAKKRDTEARRLQEEVLADYSREVQPVMDDIGRVLGQAYNCHRSLGGQGSRQSFRRAV